MKHLLLGISALLCLGLPISMSVITAWLLHDGQITAASGLTDWTLGTFATFLIAWIGAVVAYAVHKVMES